MAYNLFAQQKQQYYPTSAAPQTEGQETGTGATVVDFANGKAAANSQDVSQQPVVQQPSRIVQQTPTAKMTPVKTTPYVNPNDEQSGMDALASLYTSPEEENRLRKASLANQRIMALGDALRHIGNIYHTTKYAPSQQFNSPVKEERARYLQEKSVRDAANQRYYTYQQAKAAQDAKAKQLENEMGYKQGLLAHYADQEARLRDKDAFDRENKEAKRDLDREKFEADKKFKEGKMSVAQYNAETSRIRAVKSGRAGGGGGKYWAYDREGNIHYYPNRTMWEQGVYQFNNGLPQTETLETVTANGTNLRQQNVKPTKLGGRAAANANGGNGSGAFSGFSIHNKK